jgi:hypothetical protein
MTASQRADDSDWQRGRVMWLKCMQMIAPIYIRNRFAALSVLIEGTASWLDRPLERGAHQLSGRQDLSIVNRYGNRERTSIALTRAEMTMLVFKSHVCGNNQLWRNVK